MVPPLGSAFRHLTGSLYGQAPSAAARASSSHAREAIPRLNVPLNTEWQRLNFTAQAGHEPEIEITDEETNETLAQLGYRVEEPDESREADAVMKAAQDQMTGNPIQVFMPIIRNMLRDPGIQRATMEHLQHSPHFHQLLLASSTNDSSTPLAIEWRPAEAREGSGGLPMLLEDLGAKLKAAGQAAINTAVGCRNAVGRLLIHLGANLHALLGKPFSTTPLEEGLSDEQMEERAAVIGQALTTVAVVILSIIFLKRAHLVTV